MARVAEVIEMSIEIEDELLPMAIAQASQMDKGVMAQMLLPHVIRQVFYELPESSQVALQLPQLGVQKTPLLEHKNG